MCRQSFLAQKIEEKNRLREQASVHRTGLTPSLLRLFELRPTPQALPPLKFKLRKPPRTGIGHLVENFASPGDPEYEPPPPDTCPPSPRVFRSLEYAAQARLDQHTKIERDAFKTQEREKNHEIAIKEAAEAWDPNKDPNIEGDAYKTLFVGRLSYDVTERKLRREFEEFGPVKRIRIVHDKNSGKPKGYAFIEFEHKGDMKEAYRYADGRKIEGRRCVVDIERGRTVPEWKPRRLGGGKGGNTRASKPSKDPRKVLEKRLLARALGREEEKDGTRLPESRSEPETRERERRRSRSRDRENDRSKYRSYSRDEDDRDSRRRRSSRRDVRESHRHRDSRDSRRSRYHDQDDAGYYDRIESDRKRDRDTYEMPRSDRGEYIDYGDIVDVNAIPDYNKSSREDIAAPKSVIDDEPEEGELEAGEVPMAKKPRET